ncbi:MAG: hypothetical protein F6K28_42830 [Microcoleus sp. SIO2G3]|nr:hypothetical protein [Microcoleus sp. SIO2G3]
MRPKSARASGLWMWLLIEGNYLAALKLFQLMRGNMAEGIEVRQCNIDNALLCMS